MNSFYKILATLTILLLSSLGSIAENCNKLDAATNPIDILHYELHIDMTEFSSKRFSAVTHLKLTTSQKTAKLELNLEGLTVDSVLLKGNKMVFNQTGIQLNIALTQELKPNDTLTVSIYYQGKPIKDASWGGFYYSGNYAYNMGVAFTSAPHNYGRVWFPCIDNFTDRATYSFFITCKNDKKAFCNGLLEATKNIDSKTTEYHWEMRQPIPTYLASIALAPYKEVNFNYHSIPVILAAEAKDTSNMKASFIHLEQCIGAYIAAYGKHNFDRIGFNVVPFNGGAMEHATNIAYPKFGIDGTLAYEKLYAHELAHHWWGNSVTCRTAEDMWINEGWASFSESLFLEAIYGKKKYRDNIAANHKDVVHYAHLRDKDTLPVSGIGHSNTYGMHVYNKGADMVHTLRGFMGDTAFFKATTSFIDAYRFKDVNTAIMNSHFQQFTSIDLNPFFDEWISQPGFVHFDILESYTSSTGNGFETKVRLRQRVRFAPKKYSAVPMDITLMDNNFNTYTKQIIVGGSSTWVTIRTDFKPSFIALDMNEKISDAITDNSSIVYKTGEIVFAEALMAIDIKQLTDSALLRVEHNWVAPDGYYHKSTLPYLSKERYWKVDGIWGKDFKASATISYNGRKVGSNYRAGYLDVDLLQFETEDKLVLMYRNSPTAQWAECLDYEVITGSKFDRRGSIKINDLQKGEYSLAINDPKLVGITNIKSDNLDFKVKPNPASTKLSVTWEKKVKGIIEITDLKGNVVYTRTLNSKKHQIDLSTFSRGVYYIGFIQNNKPYHSKPFVVKGQ